MKHTTAHTIRRKWRGLTRRMRRTLAACSLQTMAGALVLVAVIVAGLASLFWYTQPNDAAARAAWHERGDIPRALALIEHDAPLAREIGDWHFELPEYDLAIAKRAYHKAVAVDPNIEFANYQLGRIYFVEGNYQTALTHINRELEINPDNRRSLYVRGLIYSYRGYPGDLEQAARDFQRFVVWAPREWAGYNDLAWVLGKLRRYEEARDVILRGFEWSDDVEDNPWMWNMLGVMQLNLDARDDALESFRRAEASAALLTEHEWRDVYPGNDPRLDARGLEVFREGIRKNIEHLEAS